MAKRLPLAVAMLIIFSAFAWAQTNAGSIVGAVRDASGAVVPGARITVTNNATNVVRRAGTNGAGQYQVPGLIPGAYTVRVAANGFAPQEAAKVPINVQSRQLVNFTLQVGQETATVQVVATQPLLQTQTPEVGGVIDQKQIVSMPLNGRRYSDLALLQSGVSAMPQSEQANPAPDKFNVSGNLSLENNFLLNGTDNNSGSENLQENSVQVVSPPPDALSEFKIQTRTYSAEFGNSAGAVINASIKSGANEFHGDAWEFLRNDKLDANTYFNNRNGLPIGKFTQNQFGGTFGGPILRNKLFFFADFQGLVSHQGTTVTSTVPTPLMKTGDFSELPASELPLTPAVASQSNCILNNVVQASCKDSVGEKIFNLFPDPNVPAAVAAEGKANSFSPANYQFVYSVPNHTYSTDGRMDADVNASNQVFGVYDFSQQNFVETAPWTSNPVVGQGNYATDALMRAQAVSLGWTTELSPATVNQFHFGFNRDRAISNPVGISVGAGQSVAGKYGLTGVPNNNFSYGLPPFFISGFTTLGGAQWRPQWQISGVWQYSDSLTSIQGNHSLAFGYEYLRSYDTFLDIRAPQGTLSANGIYTGTSNGGADFLLGDMSGAGETTAVVSHNYYPGSAYYAQDIWRLTPDFTLTYGLRYEYFSPMLSRNNWLANFYPINGGVVLPVAANASGAYARSTIHPDYNNLAPRLGFTYHMLPALVWRGGLGVFYQHRDRIGSESMLDLNPPFVFDASVSNQRGSTTPLFQLQGGFPASMFGTTVNLTKQQIRAQDPFQRTPYVEQASLGAEVQLNRNTVLDLTGVGNWARRMNRLRNANQGLVVGFDAANNNAPIVRFPYANLNTVVQSDYGAGQHNYLELATNDGSTDYAGLDVVLRRTFSSGLAYGVDYTWGHSMANFVENLTGAPTPQNAYDYGAEMSNSAFDIRQRFVANADWNLPIGRGQWLLPNANAVTNAVLGGWVVNAITEFQTGIPFTISIPGSKDQTYTGPSHQSRPNCLSDPLAGATTDPSALVNGTGFFMNPAAFAIPALGQFGSCGPRLLHGPGLENVNFSLAKEFAVREGQSLQVRGEFFNLFNHANFGLPGATLGTPGFGHITSTTTDPREVQLAVKYVF